MPQEVLSTIMLTMNEGEAIWDLWATQVEPLAAVIPYVVGVGNHEKFYNYSSYSVRFQNPALWHGDINNASDQTFWFSFDHGRVHYTMMSTEHPYEPGSPQYEWLQANLAAADANREIIPWIFVTGYQSIADTYPKSSSGIPRCRHRPMYSTRTNELNYHEPGAYFQTMIEPLLLQYHVDVDTSGHMHTYERVHPNINGTVLQAGSVYQNPGAPVYVVQGTAGVFQDFSFEKPQPAWSAVCMGQLGYGRWHIYNATHIFYEMMGLASRAQEDSFWLIKDL